MHPSMFRKAADDGSVDEQGQPVMWDWIRVPIVKGGDRGKEAVIELCLNKLDEETYIQLMVDGAKKALNASMTKITGTKTEHSRALAMEQAQKNLEKVYEGKLRITGGRAKSTGKSQEVVVLAKANVKKKLKAQAKRAGIKVSLYADSTWTKLAIKYLEGPEGPAEYVAAEEQLAAINAAEIKGIDFGELVPDKKKIAAVEAKRAERKKGGKELEEQLLGNVVQREKGKPAQHARN